MALKHSLCLFAPLLVVVACGRAASPSPEAEEPEPLSVTRWTEKTELFAEYPPLAVGQTSRFAIHLTHLDSFKAVTEGRVEVHLRATGGAVETYSADAPSRPGIFGVDVTPTGAGTRELVIVLKARGVTDDHRVGDVQVHPSAAAARAATPAADEAPGISFLKEQQWTLDFATAVVREQSLRESIRVPARVEPRPGGQADVAAPIDGRLTRVLDVTLGAHVTRGQELARVMPPAAVPGDLPQLQRARADATTALALATRDRERAERRTAAGAAPAKRLDEARAAEERAKAQLAAAEASFAQFNAARSGGAADTAGSFVVRAPIDGVIALRDATTGANVVAGTNLFRIVDASQVQVVGQIPEADAARARGATAAEIAVAGEESRVPVGRLASLGRMLDAKSRTLPITFVLDNRTLSLPVGRTVSLYLLLSAAPPRPVVPAAALVDDAGRPIVFVQREGETFERRAVTIGARSGDLVQVTEGLKAGDRVVTRGAFLVRLASLSTTVPAHGHVH